MFHLLRNNLNTLANCSLIVLIVCVILPFIGAKSREDDEENNGNNIIVLGPSGEVTSSRYVTRKSTKNGNTIIILGAGGPNANNGPANSRQSDRNEISTPPPIPPPPPPPPTPTPPLPSTDYDYHHQQPSMMSQRFVHEPLSKHHRLIKNLNHQKLLESSNKCPKGSKCSKPLTRFIPIMIPYVPKKYKKSRLKQLAKVRKGQQTSESRVNYQKMTTETKAIDPNEPQIIIRKIKNSPPILIEEVKSSDDDSFLNYHVTSNVDDPSAKNLLPSNSINSGSAKQPSVHSQLSKPLSSSFASKTVDHHSSTLMEDAKLFNNRLDSQPEEFIENDEMKKISTHKLIKSIDTLNNNINSLKMMKNSYTDPSASSSGPSSEQTVSTYSYSVPVESRSTTAVTETNESDLSPINDSNDGGQEVYDEKIFNQFYGFDHVPSIDLTSISGEDHLSNLLMSNNYENVVEMENRNDQMDSILFDHHNFPPSRENFDFLGPKKMSFEEEKSDLQSLLFGEPRWTRQNSIPNMFNDHFQMNSFPNSSPFQP